MADSFRVALSGDFRKADGSPTFPDFDLAPLRGQAMETRRQAIELLSAPNVDRAAIEKLRAAKIQHADNASRRLTRALADAAEVLTPAQRKDLAAHFARNHRRWGHG